MSKACRQCLEVKEESEFHRNKGQADGLAVFCKPCKKVKARAYYLANHEREKEKMRLYRLANPEAISEGKKRCYKRNPEKYRAMHRALYDRKRDEILAKSAEYRSKNKVRKAASDRSYVRKRMESDPSFKLSYAIRCRLGSAFRAMAVPKRGKTRDMIGCDWGFLKSYIERKFTFGMSWENRSEWHIDHIIPLASAKTVEDMERLCHYTNLQPLWAADNIRKGARMVA